MLNFSTILDILYIYCTQFPVEFPLFWTFNFFANPDIPCKYNIQNFFFDLHNSGYSISLQIRTFRTINVHNFPLNLRSSTQLIFLQIQTFCTNIMYTIFCRIYAVLDVQFFCKSRHSVHILYTISR